MATLTCLKVDYMYDEIDRAFEENYVHNLIKKGNPKFKIKIKNEFSSYFTKISL